MWSNLPPETTKYLQDLVAEDLQMPELSPSQMFKAIGKTITHDEQWFIDSFDEREALGSIRNNIAGELLGLLIDDGETHRKIVESVVNYIKPEIIQYYEWYRSQRIETLNSGGCVTCGDE
jgi:hypothetical protein